MRIHHLNCGTLQPRGARWLGTPGGSQGAPSLACHCLLLELGERLVLVDTGIGQADLRDPLGRLGPLFLAGVRPVLDPDETALRQLQLLGFRAEDVSDVLLTHLDLDHAGGLADFPRARVHLALAELQGALHEPSRAERRRYMPQQWAHQPRWQPYGPRGDSWLGFPQVQTLQGLGPELLMVPLPGHTRGHCGYAVRGAAGWLLHAGDAILDARELGFWRHPPVGVRAYHRSLAYDLRARKDSLRRLQACHQQHGHEVDIVCSHEGAAVKTRQEPG